MEGTEKENRTIARAIVTGGTGAIGLALIGELILQGVEVLALCRPGSARNSRIPAHPLVTVMGCTLEAMASLEMTQERPMTCSIIWLGTGPQGRTGRI